MTADRLRRIDEIFSAAADLPPERRADFLDDRCAGDAALRAAVETLLHHDETARADFLAGSRGPESAIVDLSGEELERFQIVRPLGEGGFGAVYLARQTRPVERDVALKVVKLGMDTKEVVARFRAERQALAMMEHPSIAKVFEAGATASGRPYFVMEHVAGTAIDHFCDEARLETRERLALFLEVCDAVQHAHQKGVVHRDLKPSNILVARVGERAVPKIIDFGIAKAIGAESADITLTLEHGGLLGTPEYMSPEQAAGQALDTRTDIYSLGVVLYHLLTGVLPFDSETLRSKAPEEIRRIIREEEPAKPSTRVRAPGETTRAVAERRRTDIRGLRRELHGDLDWITMKAMAKEQERRYATASELAADVRRYLAHEPVVAGPPGAAYRVRKFVRRNRGSVAAAAVVAVLLVGGVTGSSTGWVRALRSAEDARVAQTRAEQAGAAEGEARRRADAARTRAETQARHAREVTRFVADTLALADPAVALSADVSLRDLLAHASETVGEVFRDQPAAEATLRTVIGRAYHTLDEMELAEEHLRHALALWESMTEPDLEEHYRTVRALADTLEAQSKPVSFGPVAGALDRLACRRLAAASPALGNAFETLAFTTYTPTTMDEMRGMLEASTDAAARVLPPGDPLWPVVIDLLTNAGRTLELHHPDLARAAWAEALRLARRELPPAHPDRAALLGRLVPLLGDARETAAAETLVREAIAAQTAVLGPDHWMVAESESLLGWCLLEAGRVEEADPLLRGGYERLREARGDRSAATLRALVRLVAGEERTGRAADAERHRRAYLAAVVDMPLRTFEWRDMEVALGPAHRDLAAALRRLRAIATDVAGGSSTVAERLPALREAVEAVRRERAATLDAEDVVAPALACFLLGRCHDPWSAFLPPEIGRALAAEALSILEHWEAELPFNLAGALFYAAGSAEDPREGEGLLRRALALADRHGFSQWHRGIALVSLGRTLAAQDRYEEAEACLVEAHPLLETGAPTYRTIHTLVPLYLAWGRPDRLSAFFSPLLREALRGDTRPLAGAALVWNLTRRPGVPPDVLALVVEVAEAVCARSPDDARSLSYLGAALCRAGRDAEAVEVLRRSTDLGGSMVASAWLTPNDAFLAMALTRLGEREQAAAALARLREAVAAEFRHGGQVGWQVDANAMLLAETEAFVETRQPAEN